MIKFEIGIYQPILLYRNVHEKKTKILRKYHKFYVISIVFCKVIIFSNTNHRFFFNACIFYSISVRPLWVKMQGENKALSAGSSYDLICEVVGSRPAPVITWWKGSILMRNSTDVVSLK